MSGAHELKRFKSEIINLEQKRISVLDRIRSDQRELSSIEKQLKNASAKLEEIKNQAPGIIVSEHAMVRYLERVKGVDLKQIAREICGTEPEKVASPMNGTFPIGFHKITIRDRVIVTVTVGDK